MSWCTTLFIWLSLHVFRSIASSVLLQGGTIIAFNQTTNELQILRNGSVLVTDDRIVDVYEESNHGVPIPDDVEVVSVQNQIVVPGFIDTHHHLWQSVLRTIDSNVTLASYFAFFGDNGPGETQFTPEDSYVSQIVGALESLSAGVTTIVDHAHGSWSNATADAILEANIDSGARIYYGFSIHNLTNNWTIPEQIAKFSELASVGSYKKTPVSLGLAFDSFSTAQPDEVKQLTELAR